MARVLLHAEGDGRTGLGHLVRMAAVAGELAARHAVVLASASPHLEAIVRELAPWARGGFTRHALDLADEEPWSRGGPLAEALTRLGRDLDAELLVSDGKATYPSNAFGPIRGRARIVLVDNVRSPPDAYDALVLPTCHADPALLARVGVTKVRTGARWTFVHPAVVERIGRAPALRSGTFVSMGGADPRGLTRVAVDHLLATTGDAIVAVVGPANGARADLERLAAMEPRVTLVHGSPASQAALDGASGALCAFGITAYEAVALGAPLVVVPHDGVVDADIERFVGAFPQYVRAVPSPRDANVWPRCDGARVDGIGALGSSIEREFAHAAMS